MLTAKEDRWALALKDRSSREKVHMETLESWVLAYYFFHLAMILLFMDVTKSIV